MCSPTSIVVGPESVAFFSRTSKSCPFFHAHLAMCPNPGSAANIPAQTQSPRKSTQVSRKRPSQKPPKPSISALKASHTPRKRALPSEPAETTQSTPSQCPSESPNGNPAEAPKEPQKKRFQVSPSSTHVTTKSTWTQLKEPSPTTLQAISTNHTSCPSAPQSRPRRSPRKHPIGCPCVHCH